MIQTIISGLFGGGLVGLIEFLIRRRDERNDKNSEILAAIRRLEEKINENEAKEDQRDAEGRRRNILRFADEMMEGRKHSKDSFDSCLSDITEYEKYCSYHPEFKNNQTAATVEYIKHNYAERLEKHDFL